MPMADPTVNMIESVVQQFRPTVVYTHTACDLHQDHRNVHQATLGGHQERGQRVLL